MSLRIPAVCLALLVAASAVAGCARHRTPYAARRGAIPAPSANLNHGKALYDSQCAACHGQRGVGGPVGPALEKEYARRSYRSVYAILLDPAPPMPKLYPGQLTKNDLRDVSAYVESL
ncbi:MAG TPA: cytochrome c [Candidatus Baltobacteraceae bacterium]|nr:cytochrome c [Candidatus Baltobacteraceae bacterium]